MTSKRERKRIKVTSQIRQLSYDLKSTKKKPDEHGASVKMALFIGAGASFQSNIPVATGMIRHFKSEIYKRFGKKFSNEDEAEKWMKDQDWYNDGENDYCQLFEKCYETEAKRRSYIESIIERKQPSIGYIVLANLIKYGYLKTVITTNFDSLVSLACSNYTDIFPVVYSLGNFASEMTVSSERPRILKIHGDFLFSKLKNTKEDLERPDENMERQVKRILEEYDGIIIIGYSGSDNSVMSIFEKIPDGKTIYWCGMSEDSMSERARNFLRNKKGTFVKIEGFDELMQIVRILVELDNESITKTFQDRQLEINTKISEFENIVLVDEENAEEFDNTEIENFAEVLDKAREVTELIINGHNARDEGNFELAEKSYRGAIKLSPNNSLAYLSLGILLTDKLNMPEEAEQMLHRSIELNPNDARAYNALAYLLICKSSKLIEAEQLLRKAIDLDANFAIGYSNLGFLLSNYLNKPEEAKLLFRKAIELEIDYAPAYNNLSGLFYDEGKYEEALDTLKPLIIQNNQNLKTYFIISSIFKTLGNKKELNKYIKQAKLLIKDDDYYSLACLNSVLDKKEESLKFLKMATQKNFSIKEQAKKSPSLQWVRDDDRFWEIVSRDTE